ncbi:MAG: hypothetical protein MJZ75_04230 [Paludibacteraceae bacterium]|nr:hypothetical protein [Paludibacteraceae bacterium]
MSKHFSKTEFEYPVHRICGKISRKSKVVHRCTPSGKFITYLQGERNLVAHPVTQAELDRRTAFKTRQALVAARLEKTATTYATDMAAYRAQYATGYKSFTKYLWAQVMADETAD